MNETQNGITEKPVYFDKTETWCVLGALFFCFVPLLILLGETTDYKINERRYFCFTYLCSGIQRHVSS